MLSCTPIVTFCNRGLIVGYLKEFIKAGNYLYSVFSINSMKFDLKEVYGLLQPNIAFNIYTDQEGVN